MTAADLLTILRLILVPFFLFAFLSEKFELAFLIFVVAGVTDLVDGSIARWLKRSTDIGAILDPIADKALMVATVSCLLLKGVIPFWFFLLVVVRDIAILSGLAFFRLRKVNFSLRPLWTSKIGTLCNLILIIFAFLSFLHHSYLFWFQLFLWISTVLVVTSGTQYAKIGLDLLKKNGQSAH